MADRYTSRIALVLDRAVESVAEVVGAAVQAGDLDRRAPVGDEGAMAQEVNWGGRMQKAVVRAVTDASDDVPLLRTETYIGGDGLKQGMKRQALLVQALARQLEGRVRAVRDLSAQIDRDLAWLNRIAVGAVEQPDAITSSAEGEGTWWVYTHGAARFDVPDLELYGLSKGKIEPVQEALRSVHGQLLDKGLKADLTLPDATPVYLVPVLEAWQHVPLEWPGVGKAGVDRGRGLDGPRATLSVLHKPRFGRYKKDFGGVIEGLSAAR